MDGELLIPLLVLTALFSSVDTEHPGSFRKHRCSERLFSLLPFVERAGFRTGCSDWPVVVEEEQDANGEERAAGGAGGTHQGGGELVAMPWLGGLGLRPRAACPGAATWRQKAAFLLLLLFGQCGQHRLG